MRKMCRKSKCFSIYEYLRYFINLLQMWRCLHLKQSKLFVPRDHCANNAEILCPKYETNNHTCTYRNDLRQSKHNGTGVLFHGRITYQPETLITNIQTLSAPIVLNGRELLISVI